ncbi:hypothetical protein HGRIS_001032 [Hohenbuehelia grisea]|uniref:Uncharacterized protein n=1 Tax=Hohenbuehelia grisea TaxID=104357 RepID=A0ABR3JNY6_9AGAR
MNSSSQETFIHCVHNYDTIKFEQELLDAFLLHDEPGASTLGDEGGAPGHAGKMKGGKGAYYTRWLYRRRRVR